MTRHQTLSPAIGGMAAAVLASAAFFSQAASSFAAGSPPIVTAPSSSGTDPAEAWENTAVCLSKELGRHVSVGRAPHYGVQISGPAHPYASEEAQKAFRAQSIAAMRKCGHYLASLQAHLFTPEAQARFEDLMLEAARCMRRHGISVGDPIIGRSATGGYSIRWPHSPGVATSGPRWNRAWSACGRAATNFFTS